MARRPHVALMIETAGAYGRNLLEGITRYLRMHRPWSIFLDRRELDSVHLRWLETWQGDGVLTRWSTAEVVDLFDKSEAAVVDLSGRRSPFGAPRIHCDDQAIGRVAAEHLLHRGLRSFGYCGFGGALGDPPSRWLSRRPGQVGLPVPGLRVVVDRVGGKAVRGGSEAHRGLARIVA